MVEELEAVRELRRQAEALGTACVGSALTALYSDVLEEAIPPTMLALLERVTASRVIPRRRFWRRG